MLAMGTGNILSLIFGYLCLYLWQIDPLTPFASLSFYSLQVCLTTSTLLWAQDDHFIGSLDQTACGATMTALFLPVFCHSFVVGSSSFCHTHPLKGVCCYYGCPCSHALLAHADACSTALRVHAIAGSLLVAEHFPLE